MTHVKNCKFSRFFSRQFILTQIFKKIKLVLITDFWIKTSKTRAQKYVRIQTFVRQKCKTQTRVKKFNFWCVVLLVFSLVYFCAEKLKLKLKIVEPTLEMSYDVLIYLRNSMLSPVDQNVEESGVMDDFERYLTISNNICFSISQIHDKWSQAKRCRVTRSNFCLDLLSAGISRSGSHSSKSYQKWVR